MHTSEANVLHVLLLGTTYNPDLSHLTGIRKRLAEGDREMNPYSHQSATVKNGRAGFSVIKPYVRNAAELLDPQTLLRDIGCSFDHKKAKYGTKGHKRKRTIGVPQSEAVWMSRDLLFGLRYACGEH